MGNLACDSLVVLPILELHGRGFSLKFGRGQVTGRKGGRFLKLAVLNGPTVCVLSTGVRAPHKHGLLRPSTAAPRLPESAPTHIRRVRAWPRGCQRRAVAWSGRSQPRRSHRARAGIDGCPGCQPMSRFQIRGLGVLRNLAPNSPTVGWRVIRPKAVSGPSKNDIFGGLLVRRGFIDRNRVPPLTVTRTSNEVAGVARGGDNHIGVRKPTSRY